MKLTIGLSCIAALGVLAVVPSGLLSHARESEFTSKEFRGALQRSFGYEHSQTYDEAVRALLPVHKASPNSHLLNLRLGWLYYLKGNYANSEQHYQAAMKVAPASLEAKLGYMLPLLAQQRYSAVEVVARQVLKADSGNYYGNLRLTVALRLQRKYKQAASVAGRMLAFYPTDVSFLTELALISAAERDIETSRRLFLEILTLDPENVTARNYLDRL